MHAAVALALLIAQPPTPKLDPFVAGAIEPDAADSPLRKLQKDRVRERATALALFRQMIDTGRWQPGDFAEYTRLQGTLAENLADLMEKPADKVKCYEMRLVALKQYEALIKTRVEAGTDPPQSLNLARANRIDAEIDLLKVKEAAKGGK